MTSFYTENYVAGLHPDSCPIAGVKCVNVAKYTTSGTTLQAADVLFLFRIPINCIITNVKVRGVDNPSSVVLDVGLHNAATGVVIDADGFYNDLPVNDGPTWFTFYGSAKTTSKLNTVTYVNSAGLGRNYKTTVESALTVTVAGATITTGLVFEFVVEYYRDYAQDLATTQA